MITPSSCLKMLTISASVWLMAACTSQNIQEKTTEQAQAKPLSSGITLQHMDTLVKPGDNFTDYVNGNWVKTTQIPADKASYGAFHILRDKAEDDVKAIIEASASGKFADGSDEQKVGDFYGSYLDLKKRDSLGISPIASQLKKIQAITNSTDLASYFAHANKLGDMVPFSIQVEVDFKDPKKYMLYTWQNGLGLPDREYYFLKDAKSVDIRNKYVAHIGNMLTLAGIDKAKEKAKQIMELETAIAAKQMKKEQTRDIVALYNKYAVKDLPALLPSFEWTTFLKESGVDKQDSLMVAQVEYTKALSPILKNTPLDTWKTYLQWSLIHGSATVLTSALDKENFEFYGKTLYGTKEQRPQWRRAVDVVNSSMGEMVGKVYVKKHFPPQAKERMVTLVNNLLKAYESSIKGLDWMSEDTKKQALDKLSKFTPKIGYPDKWRDYSALKVVKGDLYGNMVRAAEFEYNRNINKLGKPVDREEWGMTPQTVNAHLRQQIKITEFKETCLIQHHSHKKQLITTTKKAGAFWDA